MSLPRTILFATSNPHKLQEVAAVLGPLGLHVQALDAIPAPVYEKIEAACALRPVAFRPVQEVPLLNTVEKKQHVRLHARRFKDRYIHHPLINRSSGLRIGLSVGGLDHFRHRTGDRRRFALLEQVDLLLREAQHIQRERPYGTCEPNIRAFHRLMIPVLFGPELSLATLTLREDGNGVWLYEASVRTAGIKKPAEGPPGRPPLSGQQPASQQALLTIARHVMSVKNRFPEPVEDGLTFTTNALIKARYYAGLTGQLCLADDSGLAVDALGGEPGVLSARYAGISGPRSTVDSANNARLLEKIRGVPDERRTAHFVCVMALCDPQRTWAIARGEVHGRITHEARGSNGFGYDPLFLLPDRGLTTAELSPERKNAISHRGRACRILADILRSLRPTQL